MRAGAAESLLLRALAGQPLQAAALGPEDEEALWVRARAHCLTPYLHALWSHSGELAALPPRLAERFGEARRLNRERNRRIAAEAGAICRALEEAGIEVLLLKGLDLADRFYGDPGLRVLYDLDLLVRPGDRTGAAAVLGTLGYRRFDDRAGTETADLVWRPRPHVWSAEGVFDPETPLLVDLQVGLWPSRWHGFDVRTGLDLWRGRRLHAIGGTRFSVPREEELLAELLVHYAFNALEGHARLMHLVDVARLVERTPGLDWERVLRIAEEHRAARFCGFTLELARRICGTAVPGGVAAALAARTPAALRSWIAAEGEAAAARMDLHGRDRRLIYALHWHAAVGARETLSILTYALLSPARGETGWRRLGAVSRRTAERLRHLIGPHPRERG